MDNTQQEQLFAKYVADKKVLIADPSGVARSSMAHMLINMGAKTANTVITGDYATAEEMLKLHKPHIVICEYDLGKRCGLDLLQRQRYERPEARNTLFILVTGNASQTAVAKSAEEDIDCYILKPFTPNTVRGAILKAAIIKLNPPPYLKKIEEGKSLLKDGKVDAAVTCFEEAKKLDAAPTLACFYLGQAKTMQKALDPAQGFYLQGLDYNKIHYKCLVGLYELLMEKKRFADAYEVIKRISHYFPANPQRLTSVLRLAILTKSYEDVERYYHLFTNIDQRSEETIRYVCAALVVCGKYYLKQALASRALELFQKAAATASGRTRILREIISALIEEDLAKDAEAFLKRFPAEAQGGADYLSMDLLVTEKLKAPGITIQRGRQLLTKGIEDPLIFQILIRCHMVAGLQDPAEGFLAQATKKWPELKDDFARAFRTPAAPKTPLA